MIAANTTRRLDREKCRVATYLFQRPYRGVIKDLRDSLQSQGLRILLQFDVKETLREDLGVDIGPCHLLCVSHPSYLLQAFVAHASVVTQLPVHIAVVEHGSESLVYVGTPAVDLYRDLDAPVRNLASRVCLAIVKGGGRQVLP